MEQVKEFPWIMLNRKHNQFEGMGGLKLKSILWPKITAERQ